jgi:anion-transporting  ArsA/GET3 family ATPase
MFMKPTGFATRVVGKGSSMAFGVLKRVVGIDLLADLGEFFQAFSGMVDGFQERARRVSELLADPATTFLVVCGPQGEPIEEAVYFHRKLVEAKLPVGGVIVNKVHYEADSEAGGEAEADLRGLLDDDLAERVAANFADYQALAQRDARNVDHLARELNAKRVIRVPYMDEDIHDLEGLLKIDRYLFATEEQREAMAASGGA